jgi:nitrite reductase (NO-forming)
MPITADYTLYEAGKYKNVAGRSSPLTQEVYFQIAEFAAEAVAGSTMDYWTFDGAVPGPMIRARLGDTIDFFLHNPRAAACRTTWTSMR